MRKFLYMFFLMLIILFCVGFALLNSQPIQLNFFWLPVRPLPLSLVVLVSFFVGIILGSIVDIGARLSLKREVKKLTRELEGIKGTQDF
jgi:uncharacterized integral membrane protein